MSRIDERVRSRQEQGETGIVVRVILLAAARGVAGNQGPPTRRSIFYELDLGCCGLALAERYLQVVEGDRRDQHVDLLAVIGERQDDGFVAEPAAIGFEIAEVAVWDGGLDHLAVAVEDRLPHLRKGEF